MSWRFSSFRRSFSSAISCACRNWSKKPVTDPLSEALSDCSGAVTVPTICSTTVEKPMVSVARSKKANITTTSAISTLKTQL